MLMIDYVDYTLCHPRPPYRTQSSYALDTLTQITIKSKAVDNSWC